jgi:hypothetical protein
MLARNNANDRVKAIGYIEQAILVIEEHNQDDEVIFNIDLPLLEDAKRCSLILWTNEVGYWRRRIIRVLNAWSECPSSTLVQVNILLPSRASMLDEAKRWFEACMMICKYVQGGKERSEKVGLLFHRFHLQH